MCGIALNKKYKMAQLSMNKLQTGGIQIRKKGV
jgi:hypothetical protein